MSNLTELKNVLTALGGTPSADDTNDETIGKIAERVGLNNLFIVELTPTAADMSGEMNHTVAEITEAYESGKDIIYKVFTETAETYIRLANVYYRGGVRYPSFNAYLINDTTEPSILVYAFTGATDDGTINTYGTTLYALQSYS